jgi:NhaP-type Na+/H+ or K+/H+ antiporter
MGMSSEQPFTTGLSWVESLLFGAIAAATDPVTVK